MHGRLWPRNSSSRKATSHAAENRTFVRYLLFRFSKAFRAMRRTWGGRELGEHCPQRLAPLLQSKKIESKEDRIEQSVASLTTTPLPQIVLILCLMGISCSFTRSRYLAALLFIVLPVSTSRGGGEARNRAEDPHHSQQGYSGRPFGARWLPLQP